MCIKARAPKLRHLARTLRINLDWLFERFTEDPCVSITYVNTKSQAADILTKATFTAVQWKALCDLIQTIPSVKPGSKEDDSSKKLDVKPVSVPESSGSSSSSSTKSVKPVKRDTSLKSKSKQQSKTSNNQHNNVSSKPVDISSQTSKNKRGNVFVARFIRAVRAKPYMADPDYTENEKVRQESWMGFWAYVHGTGAWTNLTQQLADARRENPLMPTRFDNDSGQMDVMFRRMLALLKVRIMNGVANCDSKELKRFARDLRRMYHPDKHVKCQLLAHKVSGWVQVQTQKIEDHAQTVEIWETSNTHDRGPRPRFWNGGTVGKRAYWEPWSIEYNSIKAIQRMVRDDTSWVNVNIPQPPPRPAKAAAANVPTPPPPPKAKPRPPTVDPVPRPSKAPPPELPADDEPNDAPTTSSATRRWNSASSSTAAPPRAEPKNVNHPWTSRFQTNQGEDLRVPAKAAPVFDPWQNAPNVPVKQPPAEKKAGPAPVYIPIVAKNFPVKEPPPFKAPPEQINQSQKNPKGPPPAKAFPQDVPRKAPAPPPAPPPAQPPHQAYVPPPEGPPPKATIPNPAPPPPKAEVTAPKADSVQAPASSRGNADDDDDVTMEDSDYLIRSSYPPLGNFWPRSEALAPRLTSNGPKSAAYPKSDKTFIELSNAMPFHPQTKHFDFMPTTGDTYPFTPSTIGDPVSFSPSENYEILFARKAAASSDGVMSDWIAFRKYSTEAVQRNLLPTNFNPLCRIEREDMMRTINNGTATVIPGERVNMHNAHLPAPRQWALILERLHYANCKIFKLNHTFKEISELKTELGVSAFDFPCEDNQQRRSDSPYAKKQPGLSHHAFETLFQRMQMTLVDLNMIQRKFHSWADGSNFMRCRHAFFDEHEAAELQLAKMFNYNSSVIVMEQCLPKAIAEFPSIAFSRPGFVGAVLTKVIDYCHLPLSNTGLEKEVLYFADNVVITGGQEIRASSWSRKAMPELLQRAMSPYFRLTNYEIKSEGRIQHFLEFLRRSVLNPMTCARTIVYHTNFFDVLDWREEDVEQIWIRARVFAEELKYIAPSCVFIFIVPDGSIWPEFSGVDRWNLQFFINCLLQMVSDLVVINPEAVYEPFPREEDDRHFTMSESVLGGLAYLVMHSIVLVDCVYRMVTAACGSHVKPEPFFQHQYKNPKRSSGLDNGPMAQANKTNPSSSSSASSSSGTPASFSQQQQQQETNSRNAFGRSSPSTERSGPFSPSADSESTETTHIYLFPDSEPRFHREGDKRNEVGYVPYRIERSISKMMSEVLRHRPFFNSSAMSPLTIHRTEDGMYRISDLVDHHRDFIDQRITAQNVLYVIKYSKKKRFRAIEKPKQQSTGTEIWVQATQGHSGDYLDETELGMTPITLEMIQSNGKGYAIHGSKRAYYDSIVETGLLRDANPNNRRRRESRDHIHFTDANPIPSGYVPGCKHDRDMYIIVDIKRCLAREIPFWRTGNDVIVTRGDELGSIPTECFYCIICRTTKELLWCNVENYLEIQDDRRLSHLLHPPSPPRTSVRREADNVPNLPPARRARPEPNEPGPEPEARGLQANEPSQASRSRPTTAPTPMDTDMPASPEPDPEASGERSPRSDSSRFEEMYPELGESGWPTGDRAFDDMIIVDFLRYAEGESSNDSNAHTQKQQILAAIRVCRDIRQRAQREAREPMTARSDDGESPSEIPPPMPAPEPAPKASSTASAASSSSSYASTAGSNNENNQSKVVQQILKLDPKYRGQAKALFKSPTCKIKAKPAPPPLPPPNLTARLDDGAKAKFQAYARQITETRDKLRRNGVDGKVINCHPEILELASKVRCLVISPPVKMQETGATIVLGDAPRNVEAGPSGTSEVPDPINGDTSLDGGEMNADQEGIPEDVSDEDMTGEQLDEEIFVDRLVCTAEEYEFLRTRNAQSQSNDSNEDGSTDSGSPPRRVEGTAVPQTPPRRGNDDEDDVIPATSGVPTIFHPNLEPETPEQERARLASAAEVSSPTSPVSSEPLFGSRSSVEAETATEELTFSPSSNRSESFNLAVDIAQNLRLMWKQLQEKGWTENMICCDPHIMRMSNELQEALKRTKEVENLETNRSDRYEHDEKETGYLHRKDPYKSWDDAMIELLFDTDFLIHISMMVNQLPTTVKRKRISHRGYTMVPPSLAKNRNLLVFSQDRKKIVAGAELNALFSKAKKNAELVAADLGNKLMGSFVHEFMQTWLDRGILRKHPGLEALAQLNLNHRGDLIEGILYLYSNGWFTHIGEDSAKVNHARVSLHTALVNYCYYQSHLKYESDYLVVSDPDMMNMASLVLNDVHPDSGATEEMLRLELLPVYQENENSTSTTTAASGAPTVTPQPSAGTTIEEDLQPEGDVMESDAVNMNMENVVSQESVPFQANIWDTEDFDDLQPEETVPLQAWYNGVDPTSIHLPEHDPFDEEEFGQSFMDPTRNNTTTTYGPPPETPEPETEAAPMDEPPATSNDSQSPNIHESGEEWSRPAVERPQVIPAEVWRDDKPRGIIYGRYAKKWLGVVYKELGILKGRYFMNAKKFDRPHISTAKVYDGPPSDRPRANILRSLHYREVIGPILGYNVHYYGRKSFVTIEVSPFGDVQARSGRDRVYINASTDYSLWLKHPCMSAASYIQNPNNINIPNIRREMSPIRETVEESPSDAEMSSPAANINGDTSLDVEAVPSEVQAKKMSKASQPKDNDNGESISEENEQGMDVDNDPSQEDELLRSESPPAASPSEPERMLFEGSATEEDLTYLREFMDYSGVDMSSIRQALERTKTSTENSDSSGARSEEVRPTITPVSYYSSPRKINSQDARMETVPEMSEPNFGIKDTHPRNTDERSPSMESPMTGSSSSLANQSPQEDNIGGLEHELIWSRMQHLELSGSRQTNNGNVIPNSLKVEYGQDIYRAFAGGELLDLLRRSHVTFTEHFSGDETESRGIPQDLVDSLERLKIESEGGKINEHVDSRFLAKTFMSCKDIIGTWVKHVYDVFERQLRDPNGQRRSKSPRTEEQENESAGPVSPTEDANSECSESSTSVRGVRRKKKRNSLTQRVQHRSLRRRMNRVEKRLDQSPVKDSLETGLADVLDPTKSEPTLLELQSTKDTLKLYRTETAVAKAVLNLVKTLTENHVGSPKLDQYVDSLGGRMAQLEQLRVQLDQDLENFQKKKEREQVDGLNSGSRGSDSIEVETRIGRLPGQPGSALTQAIPARIFGNYPAPAYDENSSVVSRDDHDRSTESDGRYEMPTSIFRTNPDFILGSFTTEDGKHVFDIVRTGRTRSLAARRRREELCQMKRILGMSHATGCYKDRFQTFEDWWNDLPISDAYYDSHPDWEKWVFPQKQIDHSREYWVGDGSNRTRKDLRYWQDLYWRVTTKGKDIAEFCADGWRDRGVRLVPRVPHDTRAYLHDKNVNKWIHTLRNDYEQNPSGLVYLGSNISTEEMMTTDGWMWANFEHEHENQPRQAFDMGYQVEANFSESTLIAIPTEDIRRDQPISEGRWYVVSAPRECPDPFPADQPPVPLRNQRPPPADHPRNRLYVAPEPEPKKRQFSAKEYKWYSNAGRSWYYDHDYDEYDRRW